MPLVDANIVLRYILNDHPQLSQQAADVLEQQTVIAPIEVVCEVVYVLQKVYHLILLMPFCQHIMRWSSNRY